MPARPCRLGGVPGPPPDAGQDAIAAIILEEIADDRRWDEAFARSQHQLGCLADRVREDIRAGRVKNLGIDEI